MTNQPSRSGPVMHLGGAGPDDAQIDAFAGALVSAAISLQTETDAAGFQRAALSENTRRGYASDLRQFQRWLGGYREGEVAPPGDLSLTPTCPRRPKDVVAFLTEKAMVMTKAGEWRYSPTTMGRWVAAINRDHVDHGFAPIGKDPDVLSTLSGIRRGHHRPVRRAAPS
ncbi:hypothetical protein GCM10025867_47940 (plasmid) [Frondihabitans sucicola]|uniref:Core-binding (CB) domain-containing protein n=1 Tax=Frondihabitans sucicola TaxID=1268041 RepID=A0ABM8GVW0_9MICO|nr:hypothetical protein [Frondihabitans sucicola]BDZ52553.1 hypothetical protein GCM10025867_47940 [Frondihabitans sucicola]